MKDYICGIICVLCMEGIFVTGALFGARYLTFEKLPNETEADDA